MVDYYFCFFFQLTILLGLALLGAADFGKAFEFAGLDPSVQGKTQSKLTVPTIKPFAAPTIKPFSVPTIKSFTTSTTANQVKRVTFIS